MVKKVHTPWQPSKPRTLIPTSAPRFALCYGPRAQTVSREVSTYFFIEFHDNTRGIKFLYQNFSCNRLKLKNKTQVIPGQKKMCGNFLKPFDRSNETSNRYSFFSTLLIFLEAQTGFNDNGRKNVVFLNIFKSRKIVVQS